MMSTSKLDRRIAKGSCRCLDLKFANGIGNNSNSVGIRRRRRRQQSQDDATHPSPNGNLVLILSKSSGYICQFRLEEPQIQRKQSDIEFSASTQASDPVPSAFSPGRVLCYDQSIGITVRVAPAEAANAQEPTTGEQNDTLFSLVQSSLLYEHGVSQLYPLGRIPTNDGPTNLAMDLPCLDHHAHALIREPIECGDEGFPMSTMHSMGGANNSESNWMALTLLQTPVPLLSLSLTVLSTSSPTSNSINNPLQQANWKRQLVGTFLMHSKTLSTTFQLPIGSDTKHATTITLHVDSLAVQREDRAATIFVVFPSTRITLKDQTMKAEERTQLENQTISDAETANAHNDSLSQTTKTLLDTVYCIQKQAPVPRTFLMSGPPGVGKTYSVSQVLQHSPYPIHFVSLRGSELLQTHENPARALQVQFESLAYKCRRKQEQQQPSLSSPVGLIFLDECDALVSVDSMAAMLATLLDRVTNAWDSLIVVGATNRIDSLPNYLRRAGRFDREIPMAPPNTSQRTAILKQLLEHAAGDLAALAEESLEIRRIAELCVGYVPADLNALVRRAMLLSLQDQQRSQHEMGRTDNVTFKKMTTTSRSILRYLEPAMADVTASALRDAALSAPPKMTWDDIAGDPGGAKTALRQAIEWPRTKAKAFAQLGLIPPRGILLHGPPGCAKTTLARAAAGASGVAFVSLSPAEVYASSYVGEAEAIVRRAFALARSAAPCILFFDEMDAIFGGAEDGGRGSTAEARVLSTFLNEMDGVDNHKGADGVLVLGATNRPWTLDSALLRPGRLGDKVIYIPPPDRPARRAILEMQFGDVPKDTNRLPQEQHALDVDLLSSDEHTGLMTGAEIVGACQEAKLELLKLYVDATKDRDEGQTIPPPTMTNELFLEILGKISPLLSHPAALEEFRIFEQSAVKR